MRGQAGRKQRPSRGAGGQGDCDGSEQLNQAQEYSRRRHFCQPDNFEVEADSSA